MPVGGSEKYVHQLSKQVSYTKVLRLRMEEARQNLVVRTSSFATALCYILNCAQRNILTFCLFASANHKSHECDKFRKKCNFDSQYANGIGPYDLRTSAKCMSCVQKLVASFLYL